MDWELAQRLAERVGCFMGECYRNSVLALSSLEDSGQDAVYVEGYFAVLGGVVYVEHGWLEVDGKVVDVTATLWTKGTPPQAADYHPVFRWSREQVRDKIGPKSRDLPLFDRRPSHRREMHEAHYKLWRMVRQED